MDTISINNLLILFNPVSILKNCLYNIIFFWVFKIVIFQRNSRPKFCVHSFFRRIHVLIAASLLRLSAKHQTKIMYQLFSSVSESQMPPSSGLQTWKKTVPSYICYPPKSSHGIATQKTNILNAIRTSNITNSV